MTKKKGRRPVRRRKPSLLRRFVTLVSYLFLLSLIAGAGAGFYLYHVYSGDLPDVASLRDYNPSLVTRIYDNSDAIVAEYYVEKRILIPLEKIPVMLRLATISIEDASFYEHHGLNLEGIIRAFFANMKAGHVVQGGSSITQQVAKTLLLTPERTLKRKIREAILSIRIDREFTKNEILEIYLNQIYYGHGAYGVEAAAQTYFGEHVGALDLAQIAMIASLPKAPGNYSPYLHPQRAHDRRDHALNRLLAVGAITEGQRQEAANEPITLTGLKKPANNAPWFSEYVRRHLEKKYGANTLYRGGLTVRSTINLKLQRLAREAVRYGLEKTDKRLGYAGPVGHVDIDKGEEPDWKALNPRAGPMNTAENYYTPGRTLKGVARSVDKDKVEIGFEDAHGVITTKSMSWAHPVAPSKDALWIDRIKDARKILKPGDIIETRILQGEPSEDGALRLELYQTPAVQGALLAVDPRSGYTLAMVGGYDQKTTKFNRAVQAKRQPGSAFKPIIYTAALDKGYTPASVIIDSPIIYNKALTEFKGWKPVNFEKKFFGPTTLREALTHSRNVVTIKLLKKIGVGYAVQYSRRFGITSPLEANLSLALGASPVSLIQMTYAYATLANRGVRMEPTLIKSVEDRDGAILEKHEPNGHEVISAGIAYLITNMMKNVVKQGTARNVSRHMKRPVAGKTGTTNNYVDAWFIGFTPDMVCATWVGKDNNKRLGKRETGSRVAIPIWLRFMKKALAGTPITDFTPPPDVVFQRIDKKTGQATRKTGDGYIFESFIDGTQPAIERHSEPANISTERHRPGL